MYTIFELLMEISFQHRFAYFVAEWWSVWRGGGRGDNDNDDKIDSLPIQDAIIWGIEQVGNILLCHVWGKGWKRLR